ncbi:MAG: hypothetical protein ACOYL6_05520 [Bacteriovoracaceae bacterium]
MIFWLLLFSSKVLWAYPQFLGYGYTSCLNCHYNPLGNGPLTDYGRAVSASIAGRKLYPDSVAEEKLAEYSGFFFRKPSTTWLRPSLDYRGMRLTRSYGTKQEKTEFIHMQSDVNVVVKLGVRDQFISSITYGYVPTPINKQAPNESNYRSREHYMGYRFNPELGLYTGLMDKAFGLRVADHNAFSRQTNNLSQNDQSHGATLHWGKSEFDLGVNYFIGNLNQDSNLRQKGASTIFEYTLFKNFRPGVSYLNSKSTFSKNNITALHGRIGVGKGSSLMIELGATNKESIITTKKIKSRYLFMQNHLNLMRGLFFVNTAEYYRGSVSSQDYVVRLGPGIQFFPMQRLELRADFYNTRSFNQNTASDDTWDLTAQAHLWF